MPNYKDLSPRLGIAYDLFGNGRTAVKATLSRYVQTSTVGTARLLAMGDLVDSDAGIACWDSKYHYLFWRPITAIRKSSGRKTQAPQPPPSPRSRRLRPRNYSSSSFPMTPRVIFKKRSSAGSF